MLMGSVLIDRNSDHPLGRSHCSQARRVTAEIQSRTQLRLSAPPRGTGFLLSQDEVRSSWSNEAPYSQAQPENYYFMYHGIT